MLACRDGSPPRAGRLVLVLPNGRLVDAGEELGAEGGHGGHATCHEKDRFLDEQS